MPRIRPLSLRLRLILLAAAGLLVLLLAQAAVLRETLSTLVHGHVVDGLEHDLDTLYAHLLERSGPPTEAGFALGRIYSVPLSGHYFRIRTSGGVARSRSLWDEDLQTPEVPVGERRVTREPGPLDQRLVVLTRGYRIDGQPVTLSVAEEVGPLADAVARWQRRFLGITLVVVALVLGLQLWVIRRSLQPLDAAVIACRRLETGESTPVDDRAPREIAPVLEAVNRLVRHHGLRLNRSRRALGNVSHALKTPLAVLGQLADDLAARGDEETARTLRTQLGSMTGTVEREMRRARLAGKDHPGSGFHAHRELEALVEVLRHVHGDGVDWELEVPEGVLPLDGEDMLELFGNLLDNARRWATSRVRVNLWISQRGTLEGVIEDDGPGVPEERRAHLGRGGTTLDEGGHGLGLGIVRDIIDQYHGDIHYDEGMALGGLRVELTLPLPSVPVPDEGGRGCAC
ncbi:MAG: sensor histidine kinase [Ectothiorhodospira sp.]